MAQTTVKKTKVVLGMDAKPLKDEAKEAGKAVKNLSEKAASSIANMAKMAIAAVAANGIVGFFKDSMSLAIQAGETFSKFGVIFENAIGKAEIVAQDLVDNYGLSEKAAKGLLAATGDLLTGLGAQDEVALGLSETVQKISVDIASFQDLQGGAARASEIITKAMLGERDALTALGVKILETDVQNELLLRGQQNLTGQALLLAKATATVDMIVAQSGKAIGDYARTSDSAANQLKLLGNRFEDFQINVGNAIVQNEGFGKAMAAINDLLTDKSFVDAIANIGANLAEIFTSAIPVAADIIKIISGVISVISELKDVVIPLGLAFGTYFAVDKLTPFFDKAISGFNLLKASVKQTTIDLETGTIKSAGAMSKLGNAIKNMPTAVKIGVAVFGAEIAGKILADLADTISDLHDEGMALIIKDAEETTAKAHALTKEFLDFQRAGDEYAAAFQKARQELKEFIKPTDDALTRQSKMKMWLEKLVPEWGKYQDALKAAGAKAGELNIPLSQNESIFEKTRKTIGSFTQNEIKNYLAEQKKLGNLTQIQTDQLKSLWKETEKARQEYEKLAESLGIITREGFQKLNKEAGDLTKIFNNNKAAFSGNSDQAKLFDAKLQDLIGRFGGLNKSPEVVQELNRQFREMNEIPEFPEQDNFEEFGEIADGLVTDIMPEATIRFQEAQDKVKQFLDEMERDAQDNFAEGLLKVADAVSRIGGEAAGLLNQLGILSDEGANVAGGLIDTFSSGASAFASFSTGDIIGGITSAISAIGSLAGVISDLFGGESGEMEAAKRNIHGITGLTEDWTTKIEKLAKEIGGAGSAEKAFATLLPGIIADSDNTVSSFHELVNSTREMVATLEWAGDAGWEMEASFAAAFDALILKSREMGLEGGADMTGLIMLAEEEGLAIKGIADYIDQNMINATSGWAKVMEQYGGVSIPILDEQVRLMKLTESIPPAIAAEIEGATAALIGLSNANRLNQDEFNQFSLIVEDVRAKLEEQGITGSDAAYQMQDLLNRLIFLSGEYGFTIDDSTQALIDQGIESGHLSGDIQSDAEKQIELQEKQYDLWLLIADAMGVNTKALQDMTGASESMSDSFNQNMSDMQDGLHGVADAIYDDVIPAIGQMGDINDDVMWENSIIPDLQDWKESLGIIKNSIMGDIVTSLTEMGATYDEIQSEINDNPLLQDVNFENLKSEFSNVFRDITDNARTGSRALSEALAAGMQLGFGIDVEAFRQENLESALDAFTALKDIGSIDLREIKQEIWETGKELGKLQEGTLAYDQMAEKLDNLKKNLADATAAQEVFGDLSIGVLDEMYALQQKVGENPVLVEGIQSAIDLLADFSKAQELTTDEYQDFEDIVAKSFQELLGAGFTREEALNVIGPMLEQLDFLDKEFDLSIDDLTQELIDEGKKLGAVGEIQKSETEQMIDALGIMTTVLSALVESLGVDLPENITAMIDEMVGAGVEATEEFTRKMQDGIHADIERLSDDIIAAGETGIIGIGDVVGQSPGNIDLSDSFLFEPLFDPNFNANSEIVQNISSGGNGGDSETGPTEKIINVNMSINLNVEDNTIDTIDLSRKLISVFRDNISGAVDVLVDEIDEKV